MFLRKDIFCGKSVEIVLSIPKPVLVVWPPHPSLSRGKRVNVQKKVNFSLLPHLSFPNFLVIRIGTFFKKKNIVKGKRYDMPSQPFMTSHAIFSPVSRYCVFFGNTPFAARQNRRKKLSRIEILTNDFFFFFRFLQHASRVRKEILSPSPIGRSV